MDEINEIKPATRGEERIFQNTVKGSNIFTPIVVAYYSVSDHIVELSSSSERNQHGKFDSMFKGSYGVTVITKCDDKWKHNTDLSKLCNSYDAAIAYIKSLGDEEDAH